MERSSKKCRSAYERIERYKLKVKEHDARIQMLKTELKTKRGAIHTYEALVSKHSKRGKLFRSSKQKKFIDEDGGSSDDEDEDLPLDTSLRFERSGSRHAELTLYLSAPNGSCTRHVVGFETTAGELCTRLRESGKGHTRLIHKGHELAQDVVLASTGVKHGDTLLVLSSSSSRGADDDMGSLDRRIAELEAAIRSEMTVQLQTQLASLRRSVVPSDVSGCFAGPLENDDDDGDGIPSPSPRQQCAPLASDETLGEIRAAERRLCAQMDALEQRMTNLIARLQPSPKPAVTESRSIETLESAPTAPLPPRSFPADEISAATPKPTIRKAVVESGEGCSWTLRCAVMGSDAPRLGDEDELHVDVQPADTVPDLLEAIASEMDEDPDRLTFVRRSDSRLLCAIADLKIAAAQDDCACRIQKGRLVADAQATELVDLRLTIGDDVQSLTSPTDMCQRAAAIDDGVAARQAQWRDRGRGLSTLSQADVARLQVRVDALTKLVDALDACPGLDQEMVDRLKRDLATVCDGLPPCVARAVDRLEKAVEERASLIAARVS